MQAALEQLEAPPRHRFDVDAYHRMADTGILPREDRVDLIEGSVFDLEPESSLRSRTLIHLTALVAPIVADGLVIANIRNPLRLDW